MLSDHLSSTCEWIRKTEKRQPTIAIVLGSGLGNFARALKNVKSFPYESLPHFLPTTVDGHDGKLLIGEIENEVVAVLQGRIHAYEGHSLDSVVFPVRVLATLGVKILLLTNAAGGISPEYKIGDLVAISDHINLSGNNPLLGPNLKQLGPRFPDMTKAYDRELKKTLEKCAQDSNINLKEGVYCMMLGPSYETPAEIRMLSKIGADMVGMSTVYECIAAVHMGVRVCGLSCITNFGAGVLDIPLDHADIKSVAIKIEDTFSKLLRNFILSFSPSGSFSGQEST